MREIAQGSSATLQPSFPRHPPRETRALSCLRSSVCSVFPAGFDWRRARPARRGSAHGEGRGSHPRETISPWPRSWPVCRSTDRRARAGGRPSTRSKECEAPRRHRGRRRCQQGRFAQTFCRRPRRLTERRRGAASTQRRPSEREARRARVSGPGSPRHREAARYLLRKGRASSKFSTGSRDTHPPDSARPAAPKRTTFRSRSSGGYRSARPRWPLPVFATRSGRAAPAARPT